MAELTAEPAVLEGSSAENAILLPINEMAQGNVTQEAPVLWYRLSAAVSGDYEFISGGNLPVKAALYDSDIGIEARFIPNVENESGETKSFVCTTRLMKGEDYYLALESDRTGKTGFFTISFAKKQAVAENTPEQTTEPAVETTAEPTADLTAELTDLPTTEPTTAPVTELTTVPTAVPTAEPIAEPTTVPTAEPTKAPFDASKPVTRPLHIKSSQPSAKGITAYPESSHPYTSNYEDSFYYYEPDAIGYWVVFSSDTYFEFNYDYIEFTDDDYNYIGVYYNSSWIYDSFTGSELSGKKVYVDSSYFYIDLYTDGSVNEYGFRITSIVPIYPESTAVTIYTCEQLGTNGARLTWNWYYDTAGYADGYRVFRSTSAGGTYTYSRTVLDITADISGLTTGQMYYFKVQPYREVSGVRTYFPYSAAASVQIMATPVITSAAPAGEGKALIRWNAVAGAGAYILYRSTSLSGTFAYLKTTASTSFTDTSIAAGTSYYYKVRAFRTYSYKVFSAYSAASAMVSNSTPAIQSVQQYGAAGARIVWGAVSGAGGYQVVTSASSGGTYTYLKSLTGTSLIVSGLTPGQTYWYKVRSYKLVSGVKQWSGYSAPASVSIMATPVLSSAVASGSSAVLGWSAAANAAGYRVYRSTSLSGTYAYVKTVTGLSYSDAGRRPAHTTTNLKRSGFTAQHKFKAHIRMPGR